MLRELTGVSFGSGEIFFQIIGTEPRAVGGETVGGSFTSLTIAPEGEDIVVAL